MGCKCTVWRAVKQNNKNIFQTCIYVDLNAYVITFSNVIVEIKIGKSVAPRLRALMRTCDQEQHAMYYVSVLFGGPLSKTTKTHFKHVC